MLRGKILISRRKSLFLLVFLELNNVRVFLQIRLCCFYFLPPRSFSFHLPISQRIVFRKGNHQIILIKALQQHEFISVCYSHEEQVRNGKQKDHYEVKLQRLRCNVQIQFCLFFLCKVLSITELSLLTLIILTLIIVVRALKVTENS